jgi:hypothetical protein
MEDRILSPAALLAEDHRRREWVRLKMGRVCIWELSVPELMMIADRASRPAIDKRGGMDPGESALWQILLSCYDGEADGAKRIFDHGNGEHIKAVYSLGAQDFRKLMEAIAAVNGMEEAELSALQDFSKATTAAMR